MKIPLAKVDILDEDIRLVNEVIRSGWIMQGPRVEAFEKAIAEHCKVAHAVAASSGTTALHLALEALGIGEGDEVIVPSFSWIASANAIHYCKATPVFCDVDPRTYNMDVKTIEKCVSKKTKAIMVVHQFGMPCEMKSIALFAKKNRLEIVEDAACAIGSRYLNELVGNCRYSHISCLSFHPRKVLTTGEGGMVLTNDSKVDALSRVLRNHGISAAQPDSFSHVGYNYRLTDMQAALGLQQLSRLEKTIEKRRALASRYYSLLIKNDHVLLPHEPDGCRSNFQSLMIRLKGFNEKQRNKVCEVLATAGIATRKAIFPIHHQSCYRGGKKKVHLPETDQIAVDGLVLPLFASMKEKEVDFVCGQLNRAVKSSY